MKPHKATCHPIKWDIINDVKLFPTVYSEYTVTNCQFNQSDTELQWLGSASKFIFSFILMLDLKLFPPNQEGGGYIVFGADPVGVDDSVGVSVHFFVSVHYRLNQLMDFDQICIYTMLGGGKKLIIFW